MTVSSVGVLFHVDILSIIMIFLVSFLGIVVCFFSKNYMEGDSFYPVFFLKMMTLLFSVILMTVADNLFLFLSAWSCCNLMITRLIIHKSLWKAAKASGRLAAQNFIIGFVCIVLAFALLYKATGSFSIQYIVQHSKDSWFTLIASMMLLIGAMTQSAIWPFHRWLISSLNSPTPVSAIMHAGIVNGGGFLLIRFAPLYFSAPKTLTIILIVGLISVLLGSLWKLMQHDIKRVLACSTMGQMGFMLIQCGLGLFSSAVAHIFWHGMFKAYMFLTSGRAAQEKRVDVGTQITLLCFLIASFCGLLGSYIFVTLNHLHWLALDATLIIIEIVFIACIQLALTVLADEPFKRLPLAIVLTATMSTLYAINIYCFDLILFSLKLMQPQPLNIFHVIILIALAMSWLLILFMKSSNNKYELPGWLLRFYVKMVNSSQPAPSTITTYRKAYDYE